MNDGYCYLLRSPGRFFAINEIKMIFAHMLITYDMQFDDAHPPPQPWWLNPYAEPVQLMFRKRR
jgi:hypothetical protein